MGELALPTTLDNTAHRMFGPSNTNRGVLAAAVGVACVVAVIVVVDFTSPVVVDIKEAAAVRKGWLKDSDAMGDYIDHEKDFAVKAAAKKNDIKYGIMSKVTDMRNTANVVKDNAVVSHDTKKQVASDKLAKTKERKEKRAWKDQLREITDQAYHAKCQAERAAKKAAKKKERVMKKLAQMEKNKQIAYLEKKDCNSLRKIFDKVQPEYKHLFNQACGSKRL